MSDTEQTKAEFNSGGEINIVPQGGALVGHAVVGDHHIFTNAELVISAIEKAPPSNPKAGKGDSATKTLPAVGEEMLDGTIYAGISPETNRPMFAAYNDERAVLTYDAAKPHAMKANVHGHQDWRVPTDRELRVLFKNAAAIGGFQTEPYPGEWYASASTAGPSTAISKRFGDGYEYSLMRDEPLYLRLVRG